MLPAGYRHIARTVSASAFAVGSVDVRMESLQVHLKAVDILTI